MKPDMKYRLYAASLAPHNRVILADFGDGYLVPAVWSAPDNAWNIAIICTSRWGNEPAAVWFDNRSMEPSALRGWWPLYHGWKDLTPAQGDDDA